MFTRLEMSLAITPCSRGRSTAACEPIFGLPSPIEPRWVYYPLISARARSSAGRQLRSVRQQPASVSDSGANHSAVRPASRAWLIESAGGVVMRRELLARCIYRSRKEGATPEDERDSGEAIRRRNSATLVDQWRDWPAVGRLTPAEVDSIVINLELNPSSRGMYFNGRLLLGERSSPSKMIDGTCLPGFCTAVKIASKSYGRSQLTCVTKLSCALQTLEPSEPEAIHFRLGNVRFPGQKPTHSAATYLPLPS